jgi:hypothetical protein
VTATPVLDATLYEDDIDRGSERAVRMIESLPPYWRDDPQARAYVCAVARELDRVEAAAEAMREGAFPSTADLRTLAYYETLFGLSNTSLTLAARRTDVVAHLRKRSVASRYDWQQALSAYLGLGWSYSESAPRTVTISTAVDPTGVRLPARTAFARAITPAHIALVVNANYGTFQVGISILDTDVL